MTDVRLALRAKALDVALRDEVFVVALKERDGTLGYHASVLTGQETAALLVDLGEDLALRFGDHWGRLCGFVSALATASEARIVSTYALSSGVTSEPVASAALAACEAAFLLRTL